ncbi:hypothetical protein [Pseudomonas citri]|uniref:hypothetical protein n=1 Tax=Pseudomonas citri TaxID=2978349 RepID=UPI0021B567D2|nr:hypothetical protein [Pseudomonas citri]
MELRQLLVPIAALVTCASTYAATPSFENFVACDASSLAVVSQPALKERVSSQLENGQIKLSGGTKTDLGQRWVFDKPVVVDGISLTGFFAEDVDLMGSRVINWGFYTQQSPDELFAHFQKVTGADLEKTNGIYARAQIWSHKQSAWVSEKGDSTAGKLVTDTAERILMVEPGPGDLAKTSKGMLTCSVQGNVTEAMLKTTRPDLIR